MNKTTIKVLTQKSDRRFIRFLIAGGINTVVGFGVIFALMFLNITPRISNLCGYTAGLTVSFILNRHWVFRASSTSVKKQIIYFLLIFMIAFGVNFLVLNILLIVSINAWFAQIAAGISYTLVFYVLNKRVVFA